ncbi:bifunctional phosphoglucose/phosphomannose isomerase [Candidatus Woesearchaeota archaeon CG10_big_fil_rev_8_21_14_0_10_44_13]|nr:MAG: bifunctional phosphoglucose/phosphomannose isomerase [Candidatus Woesearchaeota archaeon CG10_big_fil_rev_8_21_14_0_10_44_13]
MANVDKENMISVLDNFWKQCEDAQRLGKNIVVGLPINGIVLCGMGGSAFAGAILHSYLDFSVPFEVCRSYFLPKWVDHNTLVIVASYSGNTEEPLAAFKEARAKKAKIVGIAKGGKLEEMCIQAKAPFIKVPSGLQPRDAMGYLTLPLINVLQNSRIIKDKTGEIEDAIGALKKSHHENAKDIAAKLKGKIPVIYSSQKLECIARIWKCKINENAKTTAFFNVFSELNHNEIESYINPAKNLFVIIIEDKNDFDRIKKRMAIMKKLVQDSGIPVLYIKLSGDSLLARILSSVLLGSYVGYYLALENGADPTEVEILENFKKQLGTPIN